LPVRRRTRGAGRLPRAEGSALFRARFDLGPRGDQRARARGATARGSPSRGLSGALRLELDSGRGGAGGLAGTGTGSNRGAPGRTRLPVRARALHGGPPRLGMVARLVSAARSRELGPAHALFDGGLSRELGRNSVCASMAVGSPDMAYSLLSGIRV